MITEALLEMDFFREIVALFESLYGANFLTLLKPSPQQEAWVGFDQGWVRTSLSTQQLFDQLGQTILRRRRTVQQFWFGYFLQFKVVEYMTRRSRHIPQHYSTPYLRAELSLSPNSTTGLSQHETLLRLSSVKHASVYYACPMLFSVADIWKQPDISLIQFVDIRPSPVGWATNQRHFITFQDENDPAPFWQSEPVTGKALRAKEWVSEDSDFSPKKMTGGQLQDLIESTIEVIWGEGGKALFWEHKMYTRVMPEAFTILKFEIPD